MGSRVWKAFATGLETDDGSSVTTSHGLPVLSPDGGTTLFVPVSGLGAVAGTRKNVGGYAITLATDQTSTPVTRGGGNRWVAPRACTVTAISASLSVALTGAGQDVSVAVVILDAAGTPGTPSAALLTLTVDGGEVSANATLGTPIAVAAGESVMVLYTSTTITNTPSLAVDVEVTE